MEMLELPKKNQPLIWIGIGCLVLLFCCCCLIVALALVGPVLESGKF